MTTTTLEKRATVTSASKKTKARGLTAPAPKKELPAELKAAANAFAKDVKKGKPAKAAVKKLEKAATVKPAPKSKAKAEPKPRKVSAMWVMRTCLANNLEADVEMISKACRDAGVPKSDGTIQTIMSDFRQTYAALLEAGRIKT